MLHKVRYDPANVSLTGFASNMTGAGPWTGAIAALVSLGCEGPLLRAVLD